VADERSDSSSVVVVALSLRFVCCGEGRGGWRTGECWEKRGVVMWCIRSSSCRRALQHHSIFSTCWFCILPSWLLGALLGFPMT
jgi:hypothetical protein